MFSIFSSGFALFDKFQEEIVDDVPSDDEYRRKPIKKPDRDKIYEPDDDDDQIDTGGGSGFE